MRPIPWIVVALICTSATARAQRPLNLDFEMPGAASPSTPWSWSCTAGNKPCGFEVALDTKVKRHGQRSLRIARRDDGTSGSVDVTSFYINDPKVLAAKHIVFSGWIRTAALSNGNAALSIVAVRKGPALVLKMAGSAQTRTTPWKRYVVDVTPDSQPMAIQLSVQVTGVGTAWFDALALSVDGQAYEAQPTPQPPVSEAEAVQLRHAAVAFRTVDADGDFADLRPLKAMIGDAHLIALGEATHGTSEFFRMKRRLIEYFARELGVTVVAIEANQLEAERVNHYVLTGEGDAMVATSGLFAIWRTREMQDTIEWMRRYNAAGPGRLEFVGYDMQDPRLPIERLVAFLNQVEPQYAETAAAAYAEMREAWDKQEYPFAYAHLSSHVYTSWAQRAKEVLSHVESHRADYLHDAEKDSVDWAIQNAKVALQAASLNFAKDKLAFREGCMVENLRWHLNRRAAGTRVVVWAHNSHIGRQPPPMWTTTMGATLDRERGSDYRAIALTTFEGTYNATANAPPEQRHYVPTPLWPSPPGSVEATLHSLGSRLLVDLRAANADGAPSATSAPRLFHYAGAFADEWPFREEAVANFYDVLVFMDRTTASHVLMCPAGLRCAS